MSRRETVPFHVSSESATDKGDGRFEIPLEPPLDVGHTAHPTVYLNNLSFTNTFANIDKDLYDNADLTLTLSQDGSTVDIPIVIPTGNYTLAELETAINAAIQDYPTFDVDDYTDVLDAIEHDGEQGVVTGSIPTGPVSVEIDGETTTVGSHTIDTNFVGPLVMRKLLPSLPQESDTFMKYAQALTIDECVQVPLGVLPPMTKALVTSNAPGNTSEGSTTLHHDMTVRFGVKPVTLEADFQANRVRMCFAPGVTINTAASSTLLSKVLGISSTVASSNSDFRVLTGDTAARIDKTRAVAFHCPSLASGTYGTSGKHGDSQLAVVPITVPVGSVQSWETFNPIRIPSHVAGGPVSALNFYISNEEGERINTLGERFEAVMVVEYDRPVK